MLSYRTTREFLGVAVGTLEGADRDGGADEPEPASPASSRTRPPPTPTLLNRSTGIPEL
ncbi:hypothetical protein ACIQM0_28645 [Streptomyces sp. NPDC091387]|uniref:hypothetical protein n=1 Tax=Streptomyces sp. NPDC091387 TaxID=3365998 RepID=UPI003815ABBC